MTDEAERRRRIRKKVWLAVSFAAALLILLIVPPLISIGRYKGQITQLLSESLGRQVRLSSVELHLLPRPEFVLTDLTVEEDPGYGAEPILHANTVSAAIRLMSLWRGRLEISTISVDEASVNLVRTADGQWNLDSLFRTAAAHTHGSPDGKAHPLPYLEATNSRVNLKNGLEKLPYSLVNADLSFWQENPGDWRLRLRGQPARTDVSLDLADTGIVQLEARLRRAPELKLMPIHVEMEWREAQLGQLSRLLVGSDPGWRGDLTGELQLDGDAESSQVKMRLRATGVHRAEFAPVDPLDFDANCTLIYHYSARSIENLACDSPLGEGHIKISGDLPANRPEKLSVELDHLPVSAGLDLLRTLRSGISDDLDARGTVSGKLTYDPASAGEAAIAPEPSRGRPSRKAQAKSVAEAPGALRGSLDLEGFHVSADALRQPIQIAKVTLQPAPAPPGQQPGLTAQVSLPLGGSSPVALTLDLAFKGYEVTARGESTLPRLRELAHAFGVSDASVLDQLAGAPANLDVTAQGPWVPAPNETINSIERAGSTSGGELLVNASRADGDVVSGSIAFRNVNWKSGTLASPVEISQATLHLGSDTLLWDPVAFSYGPVKGTARVQTPIECASTDACPPQVDFHFERIDTAELQAALLGAREKGSVLSELIERLTPSSPALWPRLNGAVTAAVLELGPAELKNVSMDFQILPVKATISRFDAGLLGGQLHATGTLTNGDKPSYSIEGTFDKVTGTDFCQLLKMRCAGGPISGNGKVTLAGFSDQELSSSAVGTLHFEWNRGAIKSSASETIPAALTRFDLWNADATIGGGKVSLTQNQILLGRHIASAKAAVTFAEPPNVAFGVSESSQPIKH